MLTDRLVGGEARHQRDRDGDAERALERRRLHELRLEEASAVDRREYGLDDASKTSGHPTREHDLCDVAATERVEPGASRIVVSASPGAWSGVTSSRCGASIEPWTRFDSIDSSPAATRARSASNAPRRTRTARGRRPSRDRRRSGRAPVWGASDRTGHGARPPRSRSRRSGPRASRRKLDSATENASKPRRRHALRSGSARPSRHRRRAWRWARRRRTERVMTAASARA